MPLVKLEIVMEVREDELATVMLTSVVESLRVSDDTRVPKYEGILKDESGAPIGAYCLERTWKLRPHTRN
jgi:hypothetical protein